MLLCPQPRMGNRDKLSVPMVASASSQWLSDKV
jgi:hypothetical protein